MKGLLVSRGFSLYTDIWNDQPPLHTHLLALVFQLFGPSVLAGRMLNIAFSVILMRSVFVLSDGMTRPLRGLFGCLLLCSATPVIELCASVMLEVPVVSLSLVGIRLWSKYLQTHRYTDLWLTCTMIVCAFATKLTAALYLPSYAVLYCMQSQRPLGFSQIKGIVIICLLTLVGILAASSYWESIYAALRMAYFSHFASPRPVKGWSPIHLLDETPLVCATSLALVFSWRRENALLFSMMASALVFSMFHRPFWYYYAIYLIVPMAIMASEGPYQLSARLASPARRAPASAVNRMRKLSAFSPVGVYIVIAVTAMHAAYAQISLLRGRGQELSEKICLFRSIRNAHWIFTDDTMAAFWAGVPVPPELAVMPPKRFWSGQVNPNEVISILKSYKPEMIAVPEQWIADLKLGSYLGRYYIRSTNSDAENVFVIRNAGQNSTQPN